MHSPNLTQANIIRLRELFPGCVTEGRVKGEDGKVTYVVDFDLLRQELSDQIVEGPQERYQLNWPGKREALLTANAPIAKTLRPCRAQSLDFDTTQNLFIEGDNLDALKLLQETYLGKVKMIYIDPPYNTGNDFIYEDDFAENTEEFLKRSNQKDEEGNRLIANTEANGRFHSDWLSMMYPRLKLARNLLRDDGVIFISIDDNELYNLKRLCDEIFGESNFIGAFIVNSSPSAIDYGHIGKTHDYVLFYAKEILETRTWHLEEENKIFKYEDEIGPFNLYPLYNGNVAFNPTTRPNLYYPFYLNPANRYEKDFYEIGLDKKDGWIEVYPVTSQKEGIPRVWRWGKEKSKENLNREIVGYKTEDGAYRIVQKTRLTGKVIRSLQIDTEISSRKGTADLEDLFRRKVFIFPKPIELIRRFAAIGTNRESIVMDFFAGTSATAQAIMQLNAKDGGNRKFVMVQLPEPCNEESEAFRAGYKTIAEISKERIRRAGKKILEGECHEEWHKDIGFRVLKVDSSNLAEVYYTPDALNQQQLGLFTENIKADRTAEDLLFQVLLDWGVGLSWPICQATIQDKTVFFVDENALIACFDSGVDEALVKELASFAPLRVVFRDNGFVSDAVKINVEQIFKQLSPGTEVKAI